MSVVKSQRKESKFEVLHHAYQLRKEITDMLLHDFGYRPKPKEGVTENEYQQQRRYAFESWFIQDYGRYMDDSFVIAETKEELLSLLDKIKTVTDSIGIFLNPQKTRIYKLSAKFRFLQMQYCLTETGRVIVKINPKRLTTMRRKLRKLKKKLDAGEVTYPDIENMFRGWYGSYHMYMSKLQKINLVLLYDGLFEKELKGVSIWKSIQIMVSRWKKRKKCKSTI